jgi:hypothetical protein
VWPCHSANQNQSSLSLGTHPAASIKFTPTVSIGFVAGTLGNSFTHPCNQIVAGNTSHLVIDHHWHKAIVNVSLLRLVHATVGASFGLLKTFNSHRCCFLLSFVLLLILNSRSSFAYLSRCITCHGLMVSLVVFFLTKQSSSLKFTPAVNRSIRGFVVSSLVSYKPTIIRLFVGSPCQPWHSCTS